MRNLALIALLASCSKESPPDPKPATPPPPGPVEKVKPAAAPAVEATSYPDLAAALAATIPADTRVIGFGELHSRTDRAEIKSSLARFTSDALPGLAPKLSDLVVETWVVDPGASCGAKAAEATAKVEITMRRPPATKNEVGLLAEAARKAGVQPRAMTVTCDDYAKIAPAGKDVDVEAMLTLTTKELGRLVGEAVAKPGSKEARPWVAVYGGALHNDRFPDKGVEEWSYASAADKTTGDKFVEVDLIVPELADADAASQKQPWFPLSKAATGDKVSVWKRGERSFVVILPRGVKAS